MSKKYQENFIFASWVMVVDQRKSTGQNWGSLDTISYDVCHMQMLPRETFLLMTLKTTLMLMSRDIFACKVFCYGERS